MENDYDLKMQNGKRTFNRLLPALITVVFSGLCWYFSLGLSGNFGYLLWIAPIPVLIISLRTSPKVTFAVAFVSYLIGWLSWFSYLKLILTIIPTLIIMLLLSMIFAFIVILTRWTILKNGKWYSIFVFPVFFTLFEFLVFKFAPDGIAGSIACSQANYLSLVQITSVTGLLGITFLVTFFPSAAALGFHYRKDTGKVRYIGTITVVIIASIFLFGILRINNGSDKGSIKAGLVVLDEHFHHVTMKPGKIEEKLTATYYANEISDLADRGAKLVLLPERALNITKDSENEIIGILSNVAIQKRAFIITGYTNFRNPEQRNSALVISATGEILMNYDKIHMIKVLEDQFTPGKEIGLFTIDGIKAGTSICKDLDFPQYINKYGNARIAFLTVPAWDFVKDDWLHSRMAILRGVENGFSEVRTARQGRLTISDCYGRVTSEASCAKGKKVTLLGDVSLCRMNTIYARFGDWFGFLNSIAAAFFILSAFIKPFRRFRTPKDF